MAKEIIKKEEEKVTVAVKLSRSNGGFTLRQAVGEIETDEGTVEVTHSIPPGSLLFRFPNKDMYCCSAIEVMAAIMNHRGK